MMLKLKKIAYVSFIPVNISNLNAMEKENKKEKYIFSSKLFGKYDFVKLHNETTTVINKVHKYLENCKNYNITKNSIESTISENNETKKFYIKVTENEILTGFEKYKNSKKNVNKNIKYDISISLDEKNNNKITLNSNEYLITINKSEQNNNLIYQEINNIINSFNKNTNNSEDIKLLIDKINKFYEIIKDKNDEKIKNICSKINSLNKLLNMKKLSDKVILDLLDKSTIKCLNEYIESNDKYTIKLQPKKNKIKNNIFPNIVCDENGFFILSQSGDLTLTSINGESLSLFFNKTNKFNFFENNTCYEKENFVDKTIFNFYNLILYNNGNFSYFKDNCVSFSIKNHFIRNAKINNIDIINNNFLQSNITSNILNLKDQENTCIIIENAKFIKELLINQNNLSIKCLDIYKKPINILNDNNGRICIKLPIFMPVYRNSISSEMIDYKVQNNNNINNNINDNNETDIQNLFNITDLFDNILFPSYINKNENNFLEFFKYMNMYYNVQADNNNNNNNNNNKSYINDLLGTNKFFFSFLNFYSDNNISLDKQIIIGNTTYKFKSNDYVYNILKSTNSKCLEYIKNFIINNSDEFSNLFYEIEKMKNKLPIKNIFLENNNNSCKNNYKQFINILKDFIDEKIYNESKDNTTYKIYCRQVEKLISKKNVGFTVKNIINIEAKNDGKKNAECIKINLKEIMEQNNKDTNPIKDLIQTIAKNITKTLDPKNNININNISILDYIYDNIKNLDKNAELDGDLNGILHFPLDKTNRLFITIEMDEKNKEVYINVFSYLGHTDKKLNK